MTSVASPARYRFDRYELRVEDRRLLAGDKQLHIGAHAFDILVALLEHGGALVTKDQLRQRVWGKVVVEENTVQAHISALRKVLGPAVIATVSGYGYRLGVDIARDSGDEATLPGPPHNLPQALTTFIGRDKELARLKELLNETRLTTLTGAGGCGKTRLALQVAREVLVGYLDGVWLVELAGLGDAEVVPRAVAAAMGVVEQRGKTASESLAEWLSRRRLLLVLDNAEHLLDACARLVELLLRRCPGLSVLVTSRERLGIEGEQIYRLPTLQASESARLFIDRARLRQPDFELTDSHAVGVATICRRLDGIALAIELAAARIGVMSTEEMCERLDSRFDILTQGSRTALPRHRTLRSLIDWSYDLLDECEKRLLRRASVFAGGWYLDAAERVCGEPADHRSVLDVLTSLEGKSLIVAEIHSGATRFNMLETVRHFAFDRLKESGEDEEAQSRHTQFLTLVALDLQDVGQSDHARQPKLARVARDIDNFRKALSWCAESERHGTGLQLASNLKWHWRFSGSYAEGRSWVERFLRDAPTEHPREHVAQALNTLGVLSFLQTDFAYARTCHQEALAIWKELGSLRSVSAELNNLGIISMAHGDHVAARAFYEEALDLARGAGDQRGTALRLYNLGILMLETGDLVRAEALLEECLVASRDVGAWAVAQATAQLGRVKHAQGKVGEARTLLVEALAGERKFGNRHGIAHNLVLLAAASHDEGDLDTALTQLDEAFPILRAIGNKAGLAGAMITLAALCLDLGEPSRAACLLACAERTRAEGGGRYIVFVAERQARAIAAARTALGDAAFDRAWQDGRSWSIDEALGSAMHR